MSVCALFSSRLRTQRCTRPSPRSLLCSFVQTCVVVVRSDLSRQTGNARRLHRDVRPRSPLHFLDGKAMHRRAAQLRHTRARIGRLRPLAARNTPTKGHRSTTTAGSPSRPRRLHFDFLGHAQALPRNTCRAGVWSSFASARRQRAAIARHEVKDVNECMGAHVPCGLPSEDDREERSFRGDMRREHSEPRDRDDHA